MERNYLYMTYSKLHILWKSEKAHAVVRNGTLFVYQKIVMVHAR